MTSSLKKVFFRQIKDTKSRFISILLIVALGVGFFVGVKAASPSMKYSANKFFQSNNLMDYKIMSDYGFQNDDIKALEALTGVSQVMPSYSADLLVNNEGSNNVVRVQAVPEVSDGKQPINELKVVEGRLPQKSGECVVESNSDTSIKYEIGDTIELLSPSDDKKITDIVKTSSFKIVGFVESPQYIAFDKGITQVGDGSILNYMMISAKDFAYSRYTEVFLCVYKPKKYQSSFEEDYKSYIADYSSKLASLGVERVEVNKEEIVTQANEKIDSARKEIDAQKADAQADLDNGKKQVEEAEAAIAEKEQEIIDGEAQIQAAEQQLADSEAKVADGWNQLAAGEAQLNEGINEYNAGVEQYNAAYSEYMAQREVGEAQLNQAQAQLDTYGPLINGLQEIIDNGGVLSSVLQSQFDSYIIQYNDAVAQVEAGKQMIADADNQIAAAKAQLDSSAAQIQAGQNEINIQKANLTAAEKQIADGKAQLEQSKAQIADGKVQLENGKKQLEESKAQLEEGQKEFDTQFALAEEELNQKLKEIENLSNGKWYIFTRDDNPGYTSFAEDATRIDGIASVFPLFFFIVAALVCLTTMTRMVEEERTQIGTFKALGYENKTIAAKYFFYAFLAAITGSILGVVVGLLILPKTIFHSYDAMYKLPIFAIKISIPVIIIAIVCALLCTCTVAYIVAYRELKLNPATLMRPKAPKQGKRILLEKIPFIWNKMNFSSKVTTRNLFRYKARFIMTVLGVAGCTALILAAYGLKDSISVVVPKQYGEIFNYDTMMNLKYEGTLNEKKSLKDAINIDKRIKSSMMIKQTLMNGSKANEDKEVQVRLFVPESLDKFKDYVHLLDKDTEGNIKLTDDTVVITEKLAKLLNLSVGDTITVGDDAGTAVDLKISSIAENYVYNYVYISEKMYEEKFGEELKVNTVLLKLTEDGKTHEDEVAKDWLKKNDILVVTSTSYVISSFEDIISSLNSVVVLMIVCAAALAFVVLYNLTNINVAERIREIATIKVLGFTEKESANYVYRENIVLSIIGIAVGLVMGIFLSNYIVSTIEMDIVMFGRSIHGISFVYAAAFTLVFTLLVNISMYGKLNNISMVESLKSVE